jgi:uncharacterized protein YndB with AHSA1/START domain
MAETRSRTVEIVITRVLDAPRDLVFRAWTEPDLVMRWWGPKDFTTPVCEIDLRPGGVWFSCMRSPEGQDFCSKSIYHEIVEPERLVYTDSFADAEGNVVPASYYGMTEDWPLESIATVTFEEVGDKTKLKIHSADIPMGEDADLSREGWNESLDRLEEILAHLS